MRKTIRQIKMFVALAFFATALPSFTAQNSVSPAEARAIAKHLGGFLAVGSNATPPFVQLILGCEITMLNSLNP